MSAVVKARVSREKFHTVPYPLTVLNYTPSGPNNRYKSPTKNPGNKPGFFKALKERKLLWPKMKKKAIPSEDWHYARDWK